METLNQILSLLGNPEAALNLFPNPASWPILLQDALRSYRVHEIAYALGALLLLLGAASTVMSYMTGFKGAKVFFNLLLVGLLWGALTAPPKNDCLPDSGYPCVVQKEVELVNPAGEKIPYIQEQLDFSGAKGGGDYWVLPDDKRAIAQKEATSAIPPYIRYQYKTPLPPLWAGAEGLWWTLSGTANRSLQSTLLRYQEEIQDTRTRLLALVKTAFTINMAGTLTDAAVNLAVFKGLTSKSAVGKASAILLGGATGQMTNTGIAMITELFKSVAVIMALAPLTLILTYGFIVSLAGFAFYVSIFLFPIFIGLGALFGAQTVVFPLRLILVSLLVPVLVSPLVGTSIHMTYGYNTALKQFLETSADKGALAEVPMKDDPVSAFVGSLVLQAMAKQAFNAYLCMRPYFEKTTGGKYQYTGNPDRKSVTYPDGGIKTCYLDNGSGFLMWPPAYAEAPGTKEVSVLLSVPLAGGKNLPASPEDFFVRLAAYTNDGAASMLDLTSPLKLKQLRNLINDYGLVFYLPGNTPSLLAEAIRGANIDPKVKDTFTEAKIRNAYFNLGKEMDPNNVKSFKEELGQFKAKESGIYSSDPPAALHVLDRYILADRLGLDNTAIGNGGLAQTALAFFVSSVVSLALSLIVIGATWGLMGAAFGAAVRGGDTVIEAPGLAGFSGIMNFGGSVYRR